MNTTDSRLDVIRGSAAPKNHNARTIAALTSNPGCARRSVLDAAAVDKQALADHLGYPARFGLSSFAIVRGIAFEKHVKADGCAELLRLLRDRLGLPLPEVAYGDLNSVAGHDTVEARYARSRQLLDRAARSDQDAGTLLDHPLLGMTIGGRRVYLEPDLVAFQLRGQFHVVEIKSFPVIDGRADAGKVASAATQAAVYVLALRELMQQLGIDPAVVSHEVFLVCPQDFSNRPTAALLDVRKQLTVIRRQMTRLADLGSIVSTLPAGFTLDLQVDGSRLATHRNAWPAASWRISAGPEPVGTPRRWAGPCRRIWAVLAQSAPCWGWPVSPACPMTTNAKPRRCCGWRTGFDASARAVWHDHADLAGPRPRRPGRARPADHDRPARAREQPTLGLRPAHHGRRGQRTAGRRGRP